MPCCTSSALFPLITTFPTLQQSLDAPCWAGNTTSPDASELQARTVMLLWWIVGLMRLLCFDTVLQCLDFSQHCFLLVSCFNPDIDIGSSKLLPNPSQYVHRVALRQRGVPIHPAYVDKTSHIMETAPSNKAFLQILQCVARCCQRLAHPVFCRDACNTPEAQVMNTILITYLQLLSQVGTKSIRFNHTTITMSISTRIDNARLDRQEQPPEG